MSCSPTAPSPPPSSYSITTPTSTGAGRGGQPVSLHYRYVLQLIKHTHTHTHIYIYINPSGRYITDTVGFRVITDAAAAAAGLIVNMIAGTVEKAYKVYSQCQ